jgi:hypothetical protein
MLPGDFTVSEGHGHPLVSIMVTPSSFVLITLTTTQTLTKGLFFQFPNVCKLGTHVGRRK